MTLQNLHNRLLEVRAVRVHPGTDDKVLVAWNSLALIAFSEAARYLQRPDYLQVARKNADFLLRDLYPQDRLLRSWRRGQARHNAYLEDHAGLILGLLALYQSDPDERWFKAAVRIVGQMLAHFSDPEGGFFDTRDDHGPLPARPKDLEDNATPCGSSLAAEALLQLWAYTARGDWRELADGLISGVLGVAIRYPTAFGRWLCASHFASNPVKEIAVLGPLQDPRTHALISALWSAYRPNAVLAQSPYPPALDAPPLLQDRPLLNTAPTAYICQNFACLQPVNSPQDFLAQLNR